MAAREKPPGKRKTRTATKTAASYGRISDAMRVSKSAL
jgi:hypothetical protein